MEDMEKHSNCEFTFEPLELNADPPTVTQPELERLKKRFMKLDRCAALAV